MTFVENLVTLPVNQTAEARQFQFGIICESWQVLAEEDKLPLVELRDLFLNIWDPAPPMSGTGDTRHFC